MTEELQHPPSAGDLEVDDEDVEPAPLQQPARFFDALRHDHGEAVVPEQPGQSAGGLGIVIDDQHRAFPHELKSRSHGDLA